MENKVWENPVLTTNVATDLCEHDKTRCGNCGGQGCNCQCHKRS